MDSAYRSGTSLVDLPASLRHGQLRERLRDAIVSELAVTGEWLGQFDFGPPRASERPGMRSYEVLYRTGPEIGDSAR